MRRTSISYTLSHCVKCLKCVKTCPVSAITLVDNRISIDEKRCINCGQCIKACHSKGLVAQGSSLEKIKDYEYTVCLVPSALSSVCKSIEEAERLFYAIKQLGFDEVIDLSPVQGQLKHETQRICENLENGNGIASFCPAVKWLIETNYPMLMENLVPLNYASEVKAKEIRKRENGDKIGIFLLCECEAKLALAKEPYRNVTYQVDHALAIIDVFPALREHLNDGREKVRFCRAGLQASNPSVIVQKQEYLVADGFDKINEILSMEEFNLLNSFKMLYLFPCFNGCIGGHLLWGNSYLNRNNTATSTWWMRDGAFLRLKQLELGYTLPYKWTKKARIEGLRIYLQGNNLLCWSRFKLWDPELAGSGLNYPIQRTFNIGAHVTFK